MSDKLRLNSMTPDLAIKELVDGNLRFRKHEHINRDFMDEVQRSAIKQYPFAIILGCIDSRVPVEILFDQGVGDLFITRIAGNFENNDIIASMEYACKVVGSKLIMVLGHENCGAVKATCDDVRMGHITELVNRIKPAIAKTTISGDISSNNKKCVDDVAMTNVKLTIDRIKKKSNILRELESDRSIKIVGAFYYVHSGEVRLM
jgi:carbonic anhydrase